VYLQNSSSAHPKDWPFWAIKHSFVSNESLGQVFIQKSLVHFLAEVMEIKQQFLQQYDEEFSLWPKIVMSLYW